MNSYIARIESAHMLIPMPSVIEIMGLIFAMLLLGIVGIGLIASYFVLFPKISKWTLDENGKTDPKRIPAILAYLLIAIFIVGYIIYTSIIYHIDFI